MIRLTIPTRQACAWLPAVLRCTNGHNFLNDPSPRPRPPGIEPEPAGNKSEHVTSELWQTPNSWSNVLLIEQTSSDNSFVIKIKFIYTINVLQKFVD